MTVRELIDILQRYDGETKILVDGYEDGYDDIMNIATNKVIDLGEEHKKVFWYDGRYEESKEGNEVIILSRFEEGEG